MKKYLLSDKVKFATGDGPIMTISKILPGENHYVCQYWNGKSFVKKVFNKEELKLENSKLLERTMTNKHNKILINKNESFNIKETIEKIKVNYYSNYSKTPPHQKDFFNMIDGTMTCGKCGKKMGMFKSLFHWHLF